MGAGGGGRGGAGGGGGGVDSRLKWASSCFLGTKNKAKAPDGPLQSLLHTVHSNVLVLFSCLLLLILFGFSVCREHDSQPDCAFIFAFCS